MWLADLVDSRRSLTSSRLNLRRPDGKTIAGINPLTAQRPTVDGVTRSKAATSRSVNNSLTGVIPQIIEPRATGVKHQKRSIYSLNT